MELFSPLHLKFGWERHMMRFNEGIEAINAIKRVRELHSHNYSEAYECGDGCCWNPKVDECSECMDAYPCETLKILDGK